jgi:hypothetical protein
MSKKRSGTPEPLEDLTFFTDRDLGKNIPSLLRLSGLSVRAYHEEFPSPTTPDDVWIRQVGTKGWIAITHDRTIRYTPEAIDALFEAGTKTFVLIGNHPHAKLAESFLSALPQVKRIIRKHDEAFIAKVYTVNPETSKSKPVARLWYTMAQWQERQRRAGT